MLNELLWQGSHLDELVRLGDCVLRALEVARPHDGRCSRLQAGHNLWNPKNHFSLVVTWVRLQITDFCQFCKKSKKNYIRLQKDSCAAIHCLTQIHRQFNPNKHGWERILHNGWTRRTHVWNIFYNPAEIWCKGAIPGLLGSHVSLQDVGRGSDVREGWRDRAGPDTALGMRRGIWASILG